MTASESARLQAQAHGSSSPTPSRRDVSAVQHQTKQPLAHPSRPQSPSPPRSSPDSLDHHSDDSSASVSSVESSCASSFAFQPRTACASPTSDSSSVSAASASSKSFQFESYTSVTKVRQQQEDAESDASPTGRSLPLPFGVPSVASAARSSYPSSTPIVSRSFGVSRPSRVVEGIPAYEPETLEPGSRHDYGCASQPITFRNLTVRPPTAGQRRRLAHGPPPATTVTTESDGSEVEPFSAGWMTAQPREQTHQSRLQTTVSPPSAHPATAASSLAAISFHLPVPACLASVVLGLHSLCCNLRRRSEASAGAAICVLLVTFCLMQPVVLILAGVLFVSFALTSTLHLKGDQALAPSSSTSCSRCRSGSSGEVDRFAAPSALLPRAGDRLTKLIHLAQPTSPMDTCHSAGGAPFSVSALPTAADASPSLPMHSAHQLTVQLSPSHRGHRDKSSQNSPWAQEDFDDSSLARPVGSSSVSSAGLSSSSTVVRCSQFQSGSPSMPLFESTTHPFYQSRTALVGWLDHEIRNSLHAMVSMIDLLHANQPKGAPTKQPSPPAPSQRALAKVDSEDQSDSTSPDSSCSSEESTDLPLLSVSPAPDASDPEECLSVIRESTIQIQQVLIELQSMCHATDQTCPADTPPMPVAGSSTRLSAVHSRLPTPNSSQQHSQQLQLGPPMSGPPTPHLLSHQQIERRASRPQSDPQPLQAARDGADSFCDLARPPGSTPSPGDSASQRTAPSQEKSGHARMDRQPALQWPHHQHQQQHPAQMSPASDALHLAGAVASRPHSSLSVPAVLSPPGSSCCTSVPLGSLEYVDGVSTLSSPTSGAGHGSDGGAASASGDPALVSPNWCRRALDGSQVEPLAKPLPISNPMLLSVSSRLRGGTLSMPTTPMPGTRQLTVNLTRRTVGVSSRKLTGAATAAATEGHMGDIAASEGAPTTDFAFSRTKFDQPLEATSSFLDVTASASGGAASVPVPVPSEFAWSGLSAASPSGVGACAAVSAGPLCPPVIPIEVRGRQKSARDAMDFRSFRVLVVDDSMINVKILSRMLHGLGLSVYTALDGLQAVEAVQRLAEQAAPTTTVETAKASRKERQRKREAHANRRRELAPTSQQTTREGTNEENATDTAGDSPENSSFDSQPTSRTRRTRLLHSTGIDVAAAAAGGGGGGVSAGCASGSSSLPPGPVVGSARWHAKRHFDLILSDVNMPVMSGLESSQRIRAFERAHGLPTVPIIAVTANSSVQDRAACADAGMGYFVQKPFCKQDILHLVTNILQAKADDNGEGEVEAEAEADAPPGAQTNSAASEVSQLPAAAASTRTRALAPELLMPLRSLASAGEDLPRSSSSNCSGSSCAGSPSSSGFDPLASPPSATSGSCCQFGPSASPSASAASSAVDEAAGDAAPAHFVRAHSCDRPTTWIGSPTRIEQEQRPQEQEPTEEGGQHRAQPAQSRQPQTHPAALASIGPSAVPAAVFV